MSGFAVEKFHSEVFCMCNNNFCGGNLCWIILLLIIFCGCGNNQWGNNCGCETNNNNCCC